MTHTRTTDPASSHLAAAELVESGAHESQCKVVLYALEREPDCTSMELSWRFSMDRHMVARRLPDLEKRGLVQKGPMRRCNVNDRQAVTWRLCGAGERQGELFE